MCENPLEQHRDMKKCENIGSSHVKAEENLLFKLYLSMIEKNWTKIGKEVDVIETFRSEFGNNFSVIYGLGDAGKINKVSVHCDCSANLMEGEAFAEIAFRSEIVERIKDVPTFFLHLQPDVLYLPLLEKFKKVTNYCYSSGEKYDLYLPSSKVSLEIPELPYGYCFGLIEDENHVTLVTHTWVQDLGLPLSVVSYMKMFVELNIRRPHVAIFDTRDNSLVGWMMVYADGGIGQLHVVIPHRRKGLARIIVRKLAWLVKEAHGIIPPVTIDFRNSISSNFFSSEGWFKTPKRYQLIVSKM